MPDTWAKRAPLTGVVAVVLLIASFAIGSDTPDFDDSGQEVIDFYVDNEGAQFAASLLEALGALFLLFFAGTLRSAARAVPGGCRRSPSREASSRQSAS